MTSTETFDAVRARVMAHIRSRGTDADPAAVHQKLAAVYDSIDRLLAALSAGAATAAPGEWTPPALAVAGRPGPGPGHPRAVTG